MLSEYACLAKGRDLRGVDWEVGVRDSALIVTVSYGAWQLHLTDSERDFFAEAVARALTPGQVTQ